MKFYYHHVGVEGSSRDFPKTVFTELPISLVEKRIPSTIPDAEGVVDQLNLNFPTGYFNCWGVPAGASIVINNLVVGDAVLLVETTSQIGAIPALAVVKCYWNYQFIDLSAALWGSTGYPYIFFFNTEELTLTWQDFLGHCDYAPHYDPRGKFLSISDSRLESFSGGDGYLKFLRTNFVKQPKIIYPISTISVSNEISEDDEIYIANVENELEKMVLEATKNKPQLTGGKAKITKAAKSSPRDTAFSLGVKKLYGGKCAICGLNLTTPNGQLEVQSAHIYPKEQDGADDTRNGICLCRMHHWALDSGWIALDDDLTVLVKKVLPVSKDYDFIREFDGKKIAKPLREELSPHPLYLNAHRKLHGF